MVPSIKQMLTACKVFDQWYIFPVPQILLLWGMVVWSHLTVLQGTCAGGPKPAKVSHLQGTHTPQCASSLQPWKLVFKKG